MEEAVEGIGKRSEKECRREEKGRRKVRRREEGRRKGEGGGGGEEWERISLTSCCVFLW